MGHKTVLDFRKMQKILALNGYEYVRCNGSHCIYTNGERTLSVNKDINCMVAGRIIKEYNLKVE